MALGNTGVATEQGLAIEVDAKSFSRRLISDIIFPLWQVEVIKLGRVPARGVGPQPGEG
jgi:hypothetical protein